MEKTEDEIFKEFVKEYDIEDIDIPYYRQSIAFNSYMLRYRCREFANTLFDEIRILKIFRK